MKTSKYHITLLLTLLWSFFITQSYGQEYTHFNEKNGLPSNHVYRITQDYQGFIWIITENGIAKYNGSSFKIFTTENGLPTNEIWDIRVGYDNKIWYFTKANKLGYIKNDSVFNFKSSYKDEILYPKSINQNQNQISFYNKYKQYKLVNGQWKSTRNFNKNGDIEIVNHPKVGHLFIGSTLNELEVFSKKGKMLKKLNEKLPANSGYYKGQINDSLFCWASTKMMYFFNLNTLQLIKKKDFMQSNKFIRFSTSNNEVQFTGENFVGYLSKKYEIKNIVNIPKKLKSHFSFIDKNKNIWIATFNNGVYLFPYAKQKASYSLQNQKVRKLQLIKNKIIASVYRKGFFTYNKSKEKFESLYKIDNYIYDANYIKELNTAYYFTNQRVIQITNSSDLTNKVQKINCIDNINNQRSVIYSNGYLYANTSYGIDKINPKTYKTVNKYLQRGILGMITHQQQILLATVSGIKTLHNENIISVPAGAKLANKPIISLLAFNAKELIVCTKGFGVYITDFITTKKFEDSNFLNVHSAYIHKKDVWLATNKGVWHYKKIGNTFKHIGTYTLNDGLSSDNISSVIIENNKILASSNEGVSMIPIKKEKNNQFIDIYIDDVKYNNKSITHKSAKYTNGAQLLVKIETIDFSEDKAIQFSYQLTPIQKNWISATSKQITFANLPPNHYKLLIKSAGKTDVVSFEITPLWYQTGLFKIGLGALGLLLLFLIIKRYQNKIKRKAQIQQQLAEQELYALRSQMNPHFVFNSLSAIQYYINQNDFKASEEYLVMFSSLIRQFFELSKQKDIVIKEEIQLLKSYLDIEKLRFKEKLSFTITADEKLNINNRKIPTMLLQPIVENAVNHGIFNKKENGMVMVKFRYVNDNTYQVSVIDDGVGIVNARATALKRKNSSEVLNERLRFLNQNQNWKIVYTKKIAHPNKIDKGTIITFTITKL